MGGRAISNMRNPFRRKRVTAEIRERSLELLRPGDGGVIAIDRSGTVAMVFNTEGMARGVADANGRFDVRLGR